MLSRSSSLSRYLGIWQICDGGAGFLGSGGRLGVERYVLRAGEERGKREMEVDMLECVWR